MHFEPDIPSSLPIALTMGDPAGIAPEITAMAWKFYRDTNIRFFLIGHPETIQKALCNISLPNPIKINHPDQCMSAFAQGLPVLPLTLPRQVKPGQPDTDNSPAVIQSIEQAVKYCQSGQASAIVTNPISKASLYEAGFAHPGHTEFLGELATSFANWNSPQGPFMMLSGGGLRVALASVHCALREIPQLIQPRLIGNALQVLHESLQHDFGIKHPRIAMCGLNPHAGEAGAMGIEEITVLNPVAQELREQGMKVTNALPADALFREDSRSQYDGVLAMYHDQGLIPVKTLDFHGGTNITLGLPFVRVSPDHGTGFDIAGKGIARADSLISALDMAKKIARNRSNADA